VWIESRAAKLPPRSVLFVGETGSGKQLAKAGRPTDSIHGGLCNASIQRAAWMTDGSHGRSE